MNLENLFNGKCQKLGIILENKLISKLMVSKITKKVRLSWYSSIKKEKDSDDFWCRKLTFESQINALFDTSPLHQFSKFNNFLWVCWFLDKFVYPAWKLHSPYYHSFGSVVNWHVVHHIYGVTIWLEKYLLFTRQPCHNEKILINWVIFNQIWHVIVSILTLLMKFQSIHRK